MTVQELTNLIRKERDWDVEERDDHVSFTLPLDHSRQHRVTLSEFRFENAGYVRFRAVIGPESKVDIARISSALALNAHLTFGAVAISNEQYVLTETQPLGSITAGLAVRIITYLAHQSDRYEATMYGEDNE